MQRLNRISLTQRLTVMFVAAATTWDRLQGDASMFNGGPTGSHPGGPMPGMMQTNWYFKRSVEG